MTLTARICPALLASLAVYLTSCSRGDAGEQGHAAAAMAASGRQAPSAGQSPPGPARQQHRAEVKAPNGYEPMVVGGVAPSSSGNAVVLVDHPRRRGLLIFVGGTEALSLHLRLRQEHYSRPLTHDLLDKVMKELGGNIVSAQVDKLENGVFYGTLRLDRGAAGVVSIDARPSDALALAVGSAAPVFVARKVLDEAGVDLEGLDMKAPEEVEPTEEAQDRSGQVEL